MCSSFYSGKAAQKVIPCTKNNPVHKNGSTSSPRTVTQKPVHPEPVEGSMASTWIIDGFNLIRQSRDLVLIESKNFEKAQAELISRLKDFAYVSGEKVICVFDHHGSAEFHRYEEHHGPVTALFTRGGEIADEVIIEIAQNKKQAAIVVSSDRMVYETCQKAGASTMNSIEFDRVLNRIQNGPTFEEDEEGFDPKKGPQKKGPSHRRPKKDRKVYGKIKKWL